MKAVSSPTAQQVEEVCDKLAVAYGSPRLGNPIDPIDDLIFITLSNKTAVATADRLFTVLKTEFPTWKDAVDAGEERIEQLIQSGGFAKIKAQFIHRSLSKIQIDWGKCDLMQLAHLREEDAFAYLLTLPGVSNKVARCVMLYTLGFLVLPVDAHVFRVAKRLGWTTKNRADLSHDELERLVPGHLRYQFHVNALEHGRNVCRPKEPKCRSCCINSFCDFFSRSLAKS